MAKSRRVRLDKLGYAKDVRCGKGHTRYAYDGRWCQCQGCGTFRSSEDLRDEQEQAQAGKAVGE
jgi:hypothetical protein